MSAELLRRAAAKMRENAQAATPSPWGRASTDGQGVAVHHGSHDTVCLYTDRPDAIHIASWHPAVALAVADWLDSAYRDWEFSENSLGAMSVRAMSGRKNDPDPYALAVARAYLGEQA